MFENRALHSAKHLVEISAIGQAHLWQWVHRIPPTRRTSTQQIDRHRSPERASTRSLHFGRVTKVVSNFNRESHDCYFVRRHPDDGRFDRHNHTARWKSVSVNRHEIHVHSLLQWIVDTDPAAGALSARAKNRDFRLRNRDASRLRQVALNARVVDRQLVLLSL